MGSDHVLLISTPALFTFAPYAPRYLWNWASFAQFSTADVLALKHLLRRGATLYAADVAEVVRPADTVALTSWEHWYSLSENTSHSAKSQPSGTEVQKCTGVFVSYGSSAMGWRCSPATVMNLMWTGTVLQIAGAIGTAQGDGSTSGRALGRKTSSPSRRRRSSDQKLSPQVTELSDGRFAVDL